MLKGDFVCKYGLLLLLWIFQFALGEESSLATINGILVLPDGSPLNSTLITLNDGEYKSYSRSDGQFTFHNIPAGVHLLDVHDHTYFFSQIKIQLLAESKESPKCIEYIYPGALKQTIPYPLVLTAHGTMQYFELRAPFAPFSLLKNPMVIFMLISAVLMFMMPRMMENLDDDQKEHFKRQMEMQKDPSKMISSLLGDLSGSTESTTTAAKKVKRDKISRRLKRE